MADQIPLIAPALVLTTVFSIIGTLQLFAEPQILSTVAPAIDSEYTPNYAAYTNAFAFNEYGVASAQAVIIALAAFILSFAFLALTNRPPKDERDNRKRARRDGLEARRALQTRASARPVVTTQAAPGLQRAPRFGDAPAARGASAERACELGTNGEQTA